MPKRKSAIERLAAAVAEVGIEKAAEHFEFLRAMKPPAPKAQPRKTTRKEQEGFKTYERSPNKKEELA